MGRHRTAGAGSGSSRTPSIPLLSGLVVRETEFCGQRRLPIILGLDGAGVIEEAGESAPYRAGDPVVIYPGQPCETCEFCRKGEEVLCTRGRIFGEQVDGTFTEFVCAPVGSVMPKPDSLDFVQAASLSVAWLTAWRMIATKARLEPGEFSGASSAAGISV